MQIDKIEVGKTYEMGQRGLPRLVLDIIWHPSGPLFSKEYREAYVEILGGKNGPRRTRESLSWLAANATKELPGPPVSNGERASG
jgi:hypothetical protein